MVKDINKLLVGKNANIYVVLKVINNGNAQIAFVVDTDKKLLGTISDGDIRRRILKKGNLDMDAKAIMRKKFKYICVNRLVIIFWCVNNDSNYT